MAILTALCAAAVYGAADFCGGLASRKSSAVVVVVFSQLTGFMVLGIAWLALPGRFYPADLGWGAAAGVAGAIAIAALYGALAVGTMGVVSPITAVIGASVPVAVGFTLGERPAPLAFLGIALAFVAVVLVSLDAGTRSISLREPGVGLAIVSGLGIGMLYVFLARGHADSGLAILVPTRMTSICVLVAYAVLRRQSLRPSTRSLPSIAVAGALDMTANVLYVLATRHGLLSTVAVLTSLYPASTVLLARIVLNERLARIQWAGIACAAIGVLCISES